MFYHIYYNFLDRNKLFYMSKVIFVWIKVCSDVLRSPTARASGLQGKILLQRTVVVLVCENFLNGLSNTVLFDNN